MTLVSNNQSAEVLQPGKEALDFPSSLVPPQRSTVLRPGLAPVTPVRSYHLDTLLPQRLVKRIAVIGLVSDKSPGSALNKGCLESVLHKGDFMWRSTFNVYGEWKRRAVCNCHDFRTFAPLGLSNAEPPFFATTNVPSMKHSDRSISPRSSRSRASACSTLSNTPERTQIWNLRWQVWYGGYRSGKSCQGAPDLITQKMPSSTSRGLRHGLPRPSARRTGFGKSGSITAHCSSVKSNFVPAPVGIVDPFSLGYLSDMF
jgi:hypothetical protein